MSLCFNILNGVYSIVKLSLLVKFSEGGNFKLHDTTISDIVIILALI